MESGTTQKTEKVCKMVGFSVKNTIYSFDNYELQIY